MNFPKTIGIAILLFLFSIQANAQLSCANPLDIVLLLDTSNTMNGLSGSGADRHTRLWFSQAAASTFLGLLDNTQTQAGLIDFNTSAALQQPLTTNLSDVNNSLYLLRAGGYTNMGFGFTVSNEELQSPRARPAAAHIIILLTDGRPTIRRNGNICSAGVPGPQNECFDYAREEATAAKNNGIQIYTIGLGISSDENAQLLLTEIATNPDNYYPAPNATDLQGIYSELAENLCPLHIQSGIMNPQTFLQGPTPPSNTLEITIASAATPENPQEVTLQIDISNADTYIPVLSSQTYAAILTANREVISYTHASAPEVFSALNNANLPAGVYNLRITLLKDANPIDSLNLFVNVARRENIQIDEISFSNAVLIALGVLLTIGILHSKAK